jgi:anaerobic selenocysteine-containing dehydrogenase
MSWRNHARYSPPVLPRAADQPEEWENLLRLAAIAQGRGAGVDVAALDDAQFAEEAQRSFGAHADAVIAATQGLHGPLRGLDVALRAGPYGDGFGQNPEGLNLAKVMAANPSGGIDLGELQPRIPESLRTPSGKVELAPPLLIADLPRALADLQRPAPDLVVIGRRDVRTNNSWMHNLPTLAKGPFRCTALVHPTDAARLGLTDGAMAHMENAQGRLEVQVQLSADMMPGVVSLPHGWGHDLPGA